MNDLEQYIQDPQGTSDRITQILQQKASTMPSNTPMPLPQGVTQPIPQQQQMTPMDVLAQGLRAGDPQSTALLKRTQMFTGNDHAATESALQFMIDHPNDIDPNNSYQVNTALAQWSKQSGYDPQQAQQQSAPPTQQVAQRQMPSPQEISMEDLSNIASGKGTNYFGVQGQAEADNARINLENSQAARLSAIASNGGTGGAGVIAANKIMTEWNTAHPDKPMTFEQAYMAATAKQGQGVTVDPNTGQYIAAVGAPQAAGAMEAGKEGGKQSAILADAGQIETAKAKGTALGTATIDLAKLQAGMPQLQNTVNDLINLSEAATYTKGGEAYNTVIRQLGKPVPPGATAKAEYDARIKNVLLPQLKSMFGARVTNFDIQTATDLLGNPNLSPPEKRAQLNAFLQQKYAQVQSDQSLVGELGGSPAPAATPNAQQRIRTYNPSTGKLE